MALLITCDCGKKLSVKDELAGKKVKCPGCGEVLVAPTPTVVDEVTELITAEPPAKRAAKKKLDDTAISEDVGGKPAWADDKKPKSSTPKKDDDEQDEEEDEAEDDEDKPGPHWVFPGALWTEVMALGREGIWFASLKGDDLKKATRLLKSGSQPSKVLGEKAYFIPWLMITSIWCNRKLNGFTITYMNEGEATSKIQTPADREERDEIMKAIEDYMKPDVERSVLKHTPLTAMVAPIITILVTGAITVGIAILAFFIGGDWEGRGRGALVAAIFNSLHWLGALGTCGIGGVIGAFMVLWLVVRVVNPPIEVTLKPMPSKQGDDEED